MPTSHPPEPAALPVVANVSLREVLTALSDGWFDYLAAPGFGIFFSAIYVLTGICLVWFGAGTVVWAFVLSLGFPLVAPFAAVGLYEVSRRIEGGQPLVWRQVLGVVFEERRRQVPWVGAIILIYFLFWTFLAHVVFALFMGPAALINVSSSMETFLTTRGLLMMITELLIGAVFAYFLFCITAVSLPLLLDREVDFVSAMVLSVKTVRKNPVSMTVWAAVIALGLLLAMIPMFLGLFVVLPVLGHATWHLYRRALYLEPDQ